MTVKQVITLIQRVEVAVDNMDDEDNADKSEDDDDEDARINRGLDILGQFLQV